MWTFLRRDRALQGSAVVFLVVVVSYPILAFSRPAAYDWLDQLWYVIFVGLAGAVVLAACPQGVGREERRFWTLLGAALCFLWLHAILHLHVATLVAEPPDLVGANSLLLLFFFALIAAANNRPDQQNVPTALTLSHRVEVGGTAISTLFLLAYFVILPDLLEASAEEWRGVRFYELYVLLDLYLLARFARLAKLCTSQSWRVAYWLLSCAFLFFMGVHALELQAYLPGLSVSIPVVVRPLWYAPFFLIVAAVRARQFEPTPQAKAVPTRDRPRRLVVLTFAVPVVHLLLHSTNLIEPEGRAWRDILVLVYLVVMGCLAQFQYQLVRKRAEAVEEERRQALLDLERSAKDYRGLFENAHDAILIFRPEDEVVLDLNPAACNLYGLSRSELLGKSLRALSKDRTKEEQFIRETLAKGAFHNAESVHYRADGSDLHVDVNGTVVEYRGEQAILSITRDITKRKRAEERLLHGALHDSLTGLPNRALFIDRLRVNIERAKRHPDYQYAVLFLDLDRFKVVNDSLGHVKGDQLLVELARRLANCLRSGEMAARLGGDEFTVLLEGLIHPSVCTRVAERIYKRLSDPIDLGGEEVFASASIGIALGTPSYERPEEVLRDADTAMYRAKEEASTIYAIFDPVMHERAVARLQLETRLRRALERNELELHYQPIVDLRSGRLAALEALLRWHHPERGMLLPAEFLSVAEETGLSAAICREVIPQACRALKALQDTYPFARPLAVNVNLSVRNLFQADLFEVIADSLQEAGLQAEDLHLEITEGALMGKPEAASEALRVLKGIGLHVNIDDFGTGYSSLSHLQRFPVDRLKIDRSFIAGMPGDRSKLEIVRTIVAMAHNLGLEVVAEGVETPDQMELLQAMDCELGQGHLFSVPVAGNEVAALLANGGLRVCSVGQ